MADASVTSTNPNAGEGTTVNVKFCPEFDVPLNARIIVGFPPHFGVSPETVSFPRGLTRQLAIGRVFATAVEAHAELLSAAGPEGAVDAGDAEGSSKLGDEADEEGDEGAGCVVEVVVVDAERGADDAVAAEAEAAAAKRAEAEEAERPGSAGSASSKHSEADVASKEDAEEAAAEALANRTRLAAAGAAVSLTLNGVTNPGWSGNPKDFGFFSLRIIDDAGQTLSLASHISPWAINPGELGVPSVTIGGSTTAIAGSTGPTNVTFTTTNAVPLEGAVAIAFPLGFELPRDMAIAEAEGFAVEQSSLALTVREGKVIVYARGAAEGGGGGDDGGGGAPGEEGEESDGGGAAAGAGGRVSARRVLVDAATQVRIVFDRVTLPSTAGTRDSRGDERTYSIATSAAAASGVIGEGAVIDEAGIVPASKLIVTVKLPALMRFIFPARWQHHREMALLTVFALYGALIVCMYRYVLCDSCSRFDLPPPRNVLLNAGPLDDEGNLRSGARRKHVMTRREIVWLLDEVEREDLIDAIIGPGRASALAGAEKAEILKTAEINAVQARLRSYAKDEVRALFSDLQRAADGGLSFHKMQDIITRERASRILAAFHPMPNVTSGKAAFRRRVKPAKLPKNLHDMESTKYTAMLQHKNTFQISEFGARNGVGCNVPLLRESGRQRVQQGDAPWRTAYAKTVERPIGVRKERSAQRRRQLRK